MALKIRVGGLYKLNDGTVRICDGMDRGSRMDSFKLRVINNLAAYGHYNLDGIGASSALIDGVWQRRRVIKEITP